jgi:hypothetical protein
MGYRACLKLVSSLCGLALLKISKTTVKNSIKKTPLVSVIINTLLLISLLYVDNLLQLLEFEVIHTTLERVN